MNGSIAETRRVTLGSGHVESSSCFIDCRADQTGRRRRRSVDRGRYRTGGEGSAQGKMVEGAGVGGTIGRGNGFRMVGHATPAGMEGSVCTCDLEEEEQKRTVVGDTARGE